jgi:uncharacterized membrane protein YccC
MSYFSPNKNAFAYAVRILLGLLIVWYTLDFFHDAKKVWALISVIVVMDPDFNTVRTTMISRILNTIMGCVLGLAFIYFAGVHTWSILAAVVASVVISTSFRNYPSSWKLAPTTVLIVMMPALAENSGIKDALTIATNRTAEVLFGSMVAFLIGWIFSLLFRKKATVVAPEKKTEEHE